MVENEILNKIVNLYKNKYTFAQISKETGIERHKVSLILQKEGLHKKRKIEIKSFKYARDEGAFKRIDSEAKAYWLGFLYADGYINESYGIIRLVLKKDDFDHILKFKTFLKSTAPIIYDPKRQCYGITIHSVKIINDLKNLGCYQKKSLTLEFPILQQVPDCFISHFMRGYFDGDGCITHFRYTNQRRKPSFYLLGTPSFLDIYERYLLIVLKRSSPNKRIKRSSWSDSTNAIQYGGFEAVSNIFNFLYKDSTIYLERKLQKFKFYDIQLPS